MFSMSIINRPQNTVGVESFSKTCVFGRLHGTETMLFQKVAFSNNSTLERVFKKLRFQSHSSVSMGDQGGYGPRNFLAPSLAPHFS